MHANLTSLTVCTLDVGQSTNTFHHFKGNKTDLLEDRIFMMLIVLTSYIINLPMTAGSRSTNTARGTCFPEPVSLKKVLKESSPPPMVLSLGILPSGWMPCSRQYNSQHALPICTPAWPTWMEMHSRYTKKKKWL